MAQTDQRGSSREIAVFPMHGLRKMVQEGFRTRDAHVTEWIAAETPAGVVRVISRPEPLVKPAVWRRVPARGNIVDSGPRTWRLPSLTDRRRWWVDSAQAYRLPEMSTATPALIWNPFVAQSNVRLQLFNGKRVTVADLLDDWTSHYAFHSIQSEVRQAYEALFNSVDYVFANAEGTAELATRFGRHDVVLLPNGVDPDRFTQRSLAQGALTVGYVGKIGKRVDLELVTRAASRLPHVQFVFAGPILDREYREPLVAHPNIRLLGDVHYERVPELLSTFDVGWVPHRVGDFEVGGDVIKTYEYRAAGLPVLSTPIVGAGSRGLTSVTSLDGSQHIAWLGNLAQQGPRVPRDITPIPEAHTWQGKSRLILNALRRSR